MFIKICGITNRADAHEASRCGADALGFNFYPRSARYVPEETASAILQDLPTAVDPVALFVNESLAHMIAVADRLRKFRTLQVHGDALSACPNAPYRFIPAFAVKDAASLDVITGYIEVCRQKGRLATAILVDAHVPGAYGGTGQKAPWRLLRDFQPGVPLILAGGLTPDNVADAIRAVRPYGVDVASGVEKSPGQKDPDKMRQFIDNARAAAAEG